MKTDPNESAFPTTILPGTYSTMRHGISKRELFAAMAMQGLLATEYAPGWLAAEAAIEQADALIAALKEGQSE